MVCRQHSGLGRRLSVGPVRSTGQRPPPLTLLIPSYTPRTPSYHLHHLHRHYVARLLPPYPPERWRVRPTSARTESSPRRTRGSSPSRSHTHSQQLTEHHRKLHARQHTLEYRLDSAKRVISSEHFRQHKHLLHLLFLLHLLHLGVDRDPRDRPRSGTHTHTYTRHTHSNAHTH